MMGDQLPRTINLPKKSFVINGTDAKRKNIRLLQEPKFNLTLISLPRFHIHRYHHLQTYEPSLLYFTLILYNLCVLLRSSFPSQVSYNVKSSLQDLVPCKTESGYHTLIKIQTAAKTPAYIPPFLAHFQEELHGLVYITILAAAQN